MLIIERLIDLLCNGRDGLVRGGGTTNILTEYLQHVHVDLFCLKVATLDFTNRPMFKKNIYQLNNIATF